MSEEANILSRCLPTSAKFQILVKHCFCNNNWPLSERYRLRSLSRHYNAVFLEFIKACTPAKLCRNDLRQIRNAIPKIELLDLSGTDWKQLQLETADNLFRSKIITVKPGEQVNSRAGRESHPQEISNEINQFESLRFVHLLAQQCSANLDLNKLEGISIMANSPQQVLKFCRMKEEAQKLRVQVHIRNYNLTEASDRLAMQQLKVWTQEKVFLDLEMHGFLDQSEDDRQLMASQWKMLCADFNLTNLQLRLSGTFSFAPRDLGLLLQSQPYLSKVDISLDGAGFETLVIWKSPISPQILSLLNAIPFFNLCVGNHLNLLKQVVRNGLTGLGGVSTNSAGDTPEGIEQVMKCIVSKLPRLRCYRDEQFGVLGLKKMARLDLMKQLSSRLVKLHLYCFVSSGVDVGANLLGIVGELTTLQDLELSCVRKLSNGNRQNYVFNCDLEPLKKLSQLRCLQLKSIKFESLSDGGLEWLSTLQKLCWLELSVGYSKGDDLVVLNRVGDQLYQDVVQKLKRVRGINLRVFPIGD